MALTPAERVARYRTKHPDRAKASQDKYASSLKCANTRRAWQKENAEKCRENARRFKKTGKYRAWQKAYQSRPDVRKRNLESVKRWQAKPGVKEQLAPGKRRFNLKAKYGVTPEWYDTKLAEQNGTCAACLGVNENGKRLAVDHNHDTGAVRGLLCESCNLALGLLKEDAERMRRMADYICRNSEA
jgi:hypothetical protein